MHMVQYFKNQTEESELGNGNISIFNLTEVFGALTVFQLLTDFKFSVMPSFVH